MTTLTDPSVVTVTSRPLAPGSAVLHDAFWAPRIETVRRRTLPAQRDQFDRVGHLRALAGTPAPGDAAPHVFWDSDVAKWIEAASYSLAAHPDPELEARVDEVVAVLAAAQRPDGYLNTYYTTVDPAGRFTDLRDAHELYCAGHLIEAGVAHHAATGRTTLLDVVRRYADLVERTFGTGPGQLRGYDGHEEIELALVKLARATGEERYLRLAAYFVDERGREPYFFDEEARRRGTPGWFAEHFAGVEHPGRTREYLQAHVPVRDQHEAVGHAVRAMYLYSAMTDLAAGTGDASLLRACRRLWDHLATTRTYVTGGIGSSAANEGFTRDFDLPSETAYAETCAAIGLVMWAQRMLTVDRDRRYGDALERTLYNAVLSGLSADGEEFFYDNPLASRGGIGRHRWFEVACCPPNIARLLTSLPSYAFAHGEDELVVHLPLGAEVTIPVTGGTATVRVETDGPWGGRTSLRVLDTPGGRLTLSLRVPGWARGLRMRVAGHDTDPGRLLGDDGYVSVTRDWAVGDELVLEHEPEVRRVWADPRVTTEAQHVALTCGPFVYAAEEVDNGPSLVDLRIPRRAAVERVDVPGLPEVTGLRLGGERVEHPGDGLYRTEPPRRVPAEVVLVPYYAWANRGAGEMRVWLGDAEEAFPG
ncbi:glycoside hydrolase family 127 protein [Kineococcus gynurae]|uniref:Glycoside hydrolase family 127 protein n=1 Tax=Kineococcus gynurae TaxID=452979 RepID=A0ABV5LSF9_9ACTN